MTNPHLDLAREWAEYATRMGTSRKDARAAVDLIRSLPNIVVDGEEIITIYDKYRDDAITLHEAFRAVVALTAPPLLNLAELAEQGNDPQSYQWMQAQVFSTDPTLGIITGVDGYSRSAIILFTDGMAKNVPWAFITPLTGEPKLEWPGDGVVDAEIVEDDEPTLPHPEDVPEEEPWIVLCGGYEWVGVRVSGLDEHVPWTIIRMSGLGYRDVSDSDITLVSRLVPEATP